MLSRNSVQSALLAGAITMGCAATAFAEATPPIPIHQGQVTYVTGGIGATEQHELEASARNYDLKITNAEKTGAFTAGTNLLIQTKSGREVLQASDTGPLFYANLLPGEYIIHATYDGMQRVRDAKIANKGSTDVHLIWPKAG